MTSSVEVTRVTAQLDRDIQSLNESFEGLLVASQITETVRNAQERLQLRVHAARIAEASASLLRLAESLERDALLNDFEARVAGVEAALAGAAARKAAAMARLREEARLAPARAAAAGGERVCAVRVGEFTVLCHVDELAAADQESLSATLLQIAAM